jgi:hypothetical protein
MGAIMLIEIWEWLRGYRRWTPTEGRIEFLKEEHVYHDKDGEELHYTHVTGQRLVWIDARGQPHSAPVKKLDDDPQYQVKGGEIEVIRYNPANPDEFYCRKLSGMKTRYYVTTSLTILAVAAFCIGDIWLREMLGCGR